MKAHILKIAGVNNEKDFYKKFPTQEAFMAKHGAAFKKLQKAQAGKNWYDINLPDVQGMAQPLPGPQAQNYPYVGKLSQAGVPMNTGTGDANSNKIPDYLEGPDASVNQQMYPQMQPPTPQSPGYDTNKAIKTGIGMVDKVVGGIKALNAEKKALKSARTWKDVSDVSLKAFNTQDVNERQTIADTANRERKAMMPSITGEELFPVQGVGTNVLAKGGGKLPTGGLSRGDDYGSKGHPYPSVSAGDFAGGGRSYPIPTKQDAGDALRLAGLHHRPDVKAKVYAKYPELRKGQDGEIMNTYAPNTLYDDLGYEPMEESEPGFHYTPLTDDEIIKAYRGGGLIQAQGGFGFGNMMNYMGGTGGAQGGTPWGSIGNVGESLGSAAFGNNAGTQIGGGLGEAAGSFFGPIGGAVGKTAGALIGGALDRNPQRIKKAQNAMMANVGKMSGISNTRNFLGGFGGVAEDGGNLTNPQLITHFGEHSMKDIFEPDPMMNTLRSGGNLRTNQVGDIEAVSGGHLEPMSFNPYADGSGYTSMIQGQSHDESNGDHTGVLMNYKAQDGAEFEEPQVEAEGGEPIKEIGDNAVIFGDIKISKHTTGNDPDFAKYYGKTFKKAMADVAKSDAKLNDKQKKFEKDVADFEPITPIDKLKSNSLFLTQKGIDDKFAMNDALTRKASQYQEIINQHAEEMGVDAGALSRGQFKPNINTAVSKNGSNLPKAQQGLSTYTEAGRKNFYKEMSEGMANKPTSIYDYFFGEEKPKAKGAPKRKPTPEEKAKFDEVILQLSKPNNQFGIDPDAINKVYSNPDSPAAKKVISTIRKATIPAKPATAAKKVPTAAEKAKFNEVINQLTHPAFSDFGGINASNMNKLGATPKAPLASVSSKADTTPAVKAPVPAAGSAALANAKKQAGIPSSAKTVPATKANVQKAKANASTPQAAQAIDDYVSKYGIVPWTGNVMPGNKYGKKTASSFTTKEWDEIATNMGFTGHGNKEFQEFLLANPESKKLIEARHKELYNQDPFIDEKVGYGWAADALKGLRKPGTTTTPTTTAAGEKNYGVTPYKKTGLETIAGQLMPWLRKDPGEELQGNQLAGEMFALSHNQIEPVQARMYHPQLDTPYDISYQDQLNENQADFNQLRRAVGNNPEALAALASQKYGANSKVLAEQFRANQAMKNQVYTGNRATLNDAQMKNLGIMDQQYTRQEQAKSNTKATAQEALNSISSKIGQNRLENRTLQTYSNMFPDFSFDKRYRAQHTGAPVDWQVDQGIYSPDADKPLTNVPIYDKNGKVVGLQRVDDEDEATPIQPSASTPGINAEAAKKRQGGLVRAFKSL